MSGSEKEALPLTDKFWDQAAETTATAVMEERRRLADPELPASERPKYELQLKVFEAEHEMVMSRDEAAWENYQIAMDKGEQFFNLVPNDVIYFDDDQAGVGGTQALKILSVDTAKKYYA